MRMLLSDSNGGVGAKYVALLLSVALSWRATNLDLYFGFSSSPLLTSTHLTVMGGPTSLLKRLRARTLAPNALAVEVQQFLGAGLVHKRVFQDLLRHIVDVLPAVALGSAAKPGHDLHLVIDGVQSTFATLHDASGMELIPNATDDGLD